MKYVVFGTNRVAKDFVYMFKDKEILYYFKEDSEPNVIGDVLIYDLTYALADKSYDKIIVCDFDKTKKTEILQQAGFIYGQDYLYEEDFFTELDEIVIPKDRKIVIWGTGSISSSFLEKNLGLLIEFCLDNYKKASFFQGYPVLSPNEISNWEDLYIIVAVEKNTDIMKQLAELGLKEEQDYIDYKKILMSPSNMLKQTIFDKSSYDLECNTMLNHLEIFEEGFTGCCCQCFIKEKMDNILDKNIKDLWHSNIHKVMCLSAENKTYTFCNKNLCPLFVSKKNQIEQKYEKNYKDMEEYPRVLALNYDSTCNLSCITCRKHLYVASGSELEKVCCISEKIKEEYLPYVNFLITAGNGEVFASKAYKEVYTSSKCNPKLIRILTNGMLFNSRNWKEFSKKKTGSIILTVSVDAATKDTYEKIRRNGNFEIIKKNMEFASLLRKSGKLRYFRMNFVVQHENYKEMIPFVEWGEKLGVDEIFFTKILNWGTYTDEEFAKISMMEEDGITPKKELKEILLHPVMQSSIVNFGTIQYANKENVMDVVDNYYIWELEKRGGKL